CGLVGGTWRASRRTMAIGKEDCADCNPKRGDCQAKREKITAESLAEGWERSTLVLIRRDRVRLSPTFPTRQRTSTARWLSSTAPKKVGLAILTVCQI